MKINLIIQARMGSSRLPNKILKRIEDKCVLQHVIDRCSNSIYINKIVVATTTNPNDDIIEDYCLIKKIDYFRGSENNVLDRYYNNLKSTKYNVIKQKGEGVCSYYKAIITTPIDSSWLKTYCKENGVSLTGEVYKIPVHLQPLYKEQFFYVNLPNTDYYCNHHICPPLYPELTVAEVDYICDILKQAIIDYEEQSSKTNTNQKN